MEPTDVGRELAREIAGITDPTVVRRNCAFCGRERSRHDDNHGPNCLYWLIFSDDAPADA